VYALGVVCHELLTGQLPFTGESTMAVLMAHVIQAPPRVSAVEPSLPSELDEPLLRMLAKDPDERPGSAGAALDGLERAAEAAGIALKTGPIFLPRAELRPSTPGDDPWPLTSSAALATTQLQEATTGATRQSRGVPFWAFALALLVLGAAFGAAYFRQVRSGKQAAEASASARPAAATAPQTAGPATAAAAAAPRPATTLDPARIPSGRPLGSAKLAAPVASAARVQDSKHLNRAPRSAPAAVPEDLESPF
jgi:serine/threonine-protein kinase